MPPDINHEELKKLLVENQRLLIENNQLLNKMRRSAVISTIFRVIWFVIVLGLPVYAYFNYIQPNWENIKQKVDSLEQVTADSEFIKKLYDSVGKKDAI